MNDDPTAIVLPVTHRPQCGICQREAVTHIAQISVGGEGGLNKYISGSVVRLEVAGEDAVTRLQAHLADAITERRK